MERLNFKRALKYAAPILGLAALTSACRPSLQFDVQTECLPARKFNDEDLPPAISVSIEVKNILHTNGQIIKLEFEDLITHKTDLLSYSYFNYENDPQKLILEDFYGHDGTGIGGGIHLQSNQSFRVFIERNYVGKIDMEERKQLWDEADDKSEAMERFYTSHTDWAKSEVVAEKNFFEGVNCPGVPEDWKP